MGPAGFEPATSSARGWHPAKLDNGPRNSGDVDADRIICLIGMIVRLVRPELFKAGKRAPAFFALPLLGLGVLVRLECALADAVSPCPVVIGHRVMVDSVFDAAHNRILDSLFST